MNNFHQIDCFRINLNTLKILGVWPEQDSTQYYRVYSKIIVALFLLCYNFLFTFNFFFLPMDLNIYVEELIVYFLEISLCFKVLTIILSRGKILEILLILESDTFQPDDEIGKSIIRNAKLFNRRYWKTVFVIGVVSNLAHALSPFITHIFLKRELILPVCNYMFIPDEIKEKYIYLIYLYQAIGVYCQMLYCVSVDTFILGLMNLIIAQLDILDLKLRKITNESSGNDEHSFVSKLNSAIIHFDKVASFCDLVQGVFSIALFVQFGVGSCTICVCLFRFTLPASKEYFIFLIPYMSFVTVLEIMIPCWFGTKIIEKSNLLAFSLYNCDWVSQSRPFKDNLRIFVERVNRPLSIVAGKMFPLSLSTFTSIMNSSYSFFTLLRHMQSRQN